MSSKSARIWARLESILLIVVVFVIPSTGCASTDSDAGVEPSYLSTALLSVQPSGFDAIGAVNELQSIAWSDFSSQSAHDAKTQVEAMDGRVIAHKGRTCYGKYGA